MPLRLREPGVPLTTAVLVPPWRNLPVSRYRRPMAGAAGAHERHEEDALVTSLRSGDERTFAELVDSWAGWMLRLAREHVPTPSIAEEVVQETWLAVLEGLDRFRGDAALRTWVYRILLNQARRRGTRERRTVPFASLTDDGGPTVAPDRFQGLDDPHPGGWRQFPAEWPEEVALTREVQGVVADALTELPDRQRTVVALRDLDGHSSDEVCHLLGISGGNQRVLLHRGRAAVRTRLEEYFETVAAASEGTTA
jgi:RNA polymerase sigma-70 factor, ECF subfamily